jgi:hypothetical protein
VKPALALLEEWVALALFSNCGGWSVAWQDLGFIGQRHEAGAKRVHDLIEVAARKIGAADAAGKQGVAGNQKLERGKVETDRPLGVAGSVDDLGGKVLETYDLAVDESFVGRSDLRRANA